MEADETSPIRWSFGYLTHWLNPTHRRERELASANHEIEDLKDSLCEAKMGVATLSAEIEDLRMSSRAQRISTADLARSASPTQSLAPDHAPPKPKSGWFASSKKSNPMNKM